MRVENKIMRGSCALFAKIDIRGVNRLQLLKVLWEQQQPALFYYCHPGAKIPRWNEKEAKRALEYGYIDYFQGRCIKTDLTKDIVDTSDYDESNGPTFQDALNKLNKKSLSKLKT